MELSVFNITGEDTGRKIELKDSIFGIEPNNHAVYLDVKQYMANRRQGTHKAKERGEIAGSSKKIKRQKGTGGARAGNIKSPTMVGGGRAFGPKPRDYSFKLNKKVKHLARKSALSMKAGTNNIFVVENFNFEQPKTQNIITLKKNFKIDSKKMLLILSEENKNIYLSSRNLQGVDVIIASELTTYKIVDATDLLFVEGSIGVLEEIFGN